MDAPQDSYYTKDMPGLVADVRDAMSRRSDFDPAPEQEPLADWYGKQVKVKGLIGGSPEVMMVAELVVVSDMGAVLSWKGRRTFFPWASVVSMSLEKEERT